MGQMRPLLLVLATAFLVPQAAPKSPAIDLVELARVPDGGIQPEIAIDRVGVVHMVYLAGEPSTANVFYVPSSDGGKTFSRAVRANSQDGCAIATGTL